jgi:hypothetical protein
MSDRLTTCAVCVPALRYLPIGGLRDFIRESVKLAYGEGAAGMLLSEGRVAAVQSLSGTGSCRLFADFQKRCAGSVAHGPAARPARQGRAEGAEAHAARPHGRMTNLQARHGPAQLEGVAELSCTRLRPVGPARPRSFMPNTTVYIPDPTWANHFNIWRCARPSASQPASQLAS